MRVVKQRAENSKCSAERSGVREIQRASNFSEVLGEYM